MAAKHSFAGAAGLGCDDPASCSRTDTEIQVLIRYSLHKLTTVLKIEFRISMKLPVERTVKMSMACGFALATYARWLIDA